MATLPQSLSEKSFDHMLDLHLEAECDVFRQPRQFWSQLTETFGVRFVSFLGVVYLGLKGFAFTLLTSAMLPYFQAMGVSGNGFQLASVVARVPWSMKGLVGVLSDCLPLGRYHKRGYLLLSSVIGTAGFAALSALPLGSLGPSALWHVAALFCACNVMLSTFDLLCEGKYSELMREKSAGSEVLSLVWTCVQSGALVAALLTGIFVDTLGPRPLLFACLPVAALALWRTFSGDLPEKPKRSWFSLRLKLHSEPRLFGLAAAMALGSLLVGLSCALLGTRGRGIMVFAISGLLIAGSFASLPSTLAKGNLYMFLTSVAYLDVTGPLSYFYTGSTQCVLDAPHFSYSYYLAVSNVVGSLGAILGAILFQGMQSWTFRGAFCMTTVIQVVASGFDLMIVKRWNIAAGFSDQATYLFGDAACQSMAVMMAVMPMALLTARLCPRGAEATVFAILAGFQNFGTSVGSILGVFVTDLFGVKASANGPCDFENLGPLLVVTHVIAPLCVLPCIYFLVPACSMDDSTAFDEDSPAPSFCSPGPSPPASPGGFEAHSEGEEDVGEGTLVLEGLVGDDYLLMEDDGTRRPFA